VTLDSNLAKIARLHNTDVINFSEVFLALRPNINVGDELTIKIVKEGKIRQQGVGFLDDGTMVVVEDAADLIEAQYVLWSPTSTLVTRGNHIYQGC